MKGVILDADSLGSQDVNLPNLIVTPHSALVAREARQRLVTLAADNLQSYLAGSPVNQVL